MAPMPDVTDWTDDDLDELVAVATAEQRLRRLVAQAPGRAADEEERHALRLDEIAGGWHAAHGGIGTVDSPREYAPPTGAHDAWPLGSVVVCGHGNLFRSLIPANTTDPCDEANYRWWQRLDPATGEPPEPEIDDVTGLPLWSGLGVAYEAGDERAHESQPYRCRQGHTSQPDWTPPATPALWELVDVEPDPGEDEPDPGYPAWEPWDHVRPLYQSGDRVTHNGHAWEASTGNNHWEPGVYGWTDLGPVGETP